MRKRNEASVKYTHEPGLRIVCFYVHTSFICGDDLWGLIVFLGGHVTFGYWKERSTSLRNKQNARRRKEVESCFEAVLKLHEHHARTMAFTRVRVRWEIFFSFPSLSLGSELLIQEALTTPHFISSWRLRDDMTLLVSSSDLTHARWPPLWADC